MEFALVTPVVFLFVFLIFEIARLVLFSGSVNTALLTGIRQATLPQATTTEVDTLIRDELQRYGISEATIGFTPAVLLPGDPTLQIDIEVPVSTSLGLNISSISRSVVIDRE